MLSQPLRSCLQELSTANVVPSRSLAELLAGPSQQRNAFVPSTVLEIDIEQRHRPMRVDSHAAGTEQNSCRGTSIGNAADWLMHVS